MYSERTQTYVFRKMSLLQAHLCSTSTCATMPSSYILGSKQAIHATGFIKISWTLLEMATCLLLQLSSHSKNFAPNSTSLQPLYITKTAQIWCTSILKFPALHSTGQVVPIYARKSYRECKGVAVLTRNCSTIWICGHLHSPGTLPMVKRPW